MVTTFHTPESQEARCPSCGAAIKVPGRRRRVQCPKCREVITLAEADLPPRPLPKPPPPVAAPDDEPARLDAIETRIAAIEARPASEAGGTPAIDSLEQRIVALEDASKALITAARAGAEAPARPSAEPAPRPCIEITPTFDALPRPRPAPRLRWLASDEAQMLDITPVQEDALLHNLGTNAGQAITLRTITGNTFLRKRAEALKAIFQRAGWTVPDIEEIPRTSAEPGLTLAVGTLPVEREAATTYLALKAAGFAPIPVLDPDLASIGKNEHPPLSLTLAPGKGA